MRLFLTLAIVASTAIAFATDIRTAKLHLTYTSDEKMNRNVGRLEEVLGALVPEYTGAASLGILTPAVSVTTVTVTATTVNATTVNASNVVATGRVTTRQEVWSSQSTFGADNGNGATAAAVTLTYAGSYQGLVCQDAQGCTPTLSETGATDGMLWTLVGISPTTAWTFADSSGVLELSGGTSFVMGTFDVLRLMYVSDRWVEIGRNDN